MIALVEGQDLRLPPLRLHPSGDYVSDVIRETGDFFERPILDEIARRVTGGDLVDVGAHIGNHTVYLAETIPDATIHAFEPLPANLELLRRNVAPYPTVTVHPLALSDRARTVRMIAEPDNLGHSRIMEDEGVPIGVMPLDAYRFEDVTLLKIDVEGHEPQVLIGARETIKRCHPLVVAEDWLGKGYPDLLPGYRLVAEWETKHQTFMYEWTGRPTGADLAGMNDADFATFIQASGIKTVSIDKGGNEDHDD